MSTINFTKVNGIPTVQQPSGDVSFTGNVTISSDASLNQIIISENGKQKLWINSSNTLQVDGVTKTGTLSQLVGFIGPVFVNGDAGQILANTNAIASKLGIETSATFAAISTTRTDVRLVIVSVDETDGNSVNNVYLFVGATKIGQILTY